MDTMNISLPDALREFPLEELVAQGGYGTSSAYVRELSRRDQERLRLRALLLEGAESPISGRVDTEYFRALRERLMTANPRGRRD